MVFNVLIPPQGHQFDPMMNFYLYSVLLITHVNMSFHMNVFQRIKFLTPSTPSPTPGAEQNSCSICFMSFIYENTHKVRYKIFELTL